MNGKLRFGLAWLFVGLILALIWKSDWSNTELNATASGSLVLPVAAAPQDNADNDTTTIAQSAYITTQLRYATTLTATPPFTIYLPFVAKNYFYLFDDFSSPDSGWDIGENDNAVWRYLSGEYQIRLKGTNSVLGMTRELSLPANYRIEVDARQATTSTGAYGLMFGVAYGNNSYEGYQVIVFPAAQDFLLEKRSMDGVWTTLIKEGSQIAAINQGTASNHIRVDRIGDSIHIYINHILVGTCTDSSFTGAGRDTGLRVYSYDTTTDTRFDNFLATNARLENPIFSDDFSVDRGWYTGDQTNVRWSYQDEEYEILIRDTSRWAADTAPLKGGLSDYAVEADIRFPDADDGYGGLIFDLVDWDRFYVFALCPDTQAYSLWMQTTTGWHTVYSSSSAYINQGDATNRLRVEREGNTIELFVNGESLISGNERFYTGNLQVGLYAHTSTTAPLAVRFDDFALIDQGASQATTTSLFHTQAMQLRTDGTLLPNHQATDLPGR